MEREIIWSKIAQIWPSSPLIKEDALNFNKIAVPTPQLQPTACEVTDASKRRESSSRRILQRDPTNSPGLRSRTFVVTNRRREEVNGRKFYARLREYASRRSVTYTRERNLGHAIIRRRPAAALYSEIRNARLSKRGISFRPNEGKTCGRRVATSLFMPPEFNYFPRESGLKRV